MSMYFVLGFMTLIGYSIGNFIGWKQGFDSSNKIWEMTYREFRSAVLTETQKVMDAKQENK